MTDIITRLYQLIKQTDDFIAMEEQIQLYMYEVFAEQLGVVFSQINQVIKAEKQALGWQVQREDEKTLQCTFGAVCFTHTLMKDDKGASRYPLDEWLGLRKHQRYSSLVEVKVAELASEDTYRATARTLQEWTAVTLSHQTVGRILRRVGEAQSRADAEAVADLDDSSHLPGDKQVDYLFAEADGVMVRSTENKQHHEVRHGILYEGWETNGRRTRLKDRHVMMTTQSADVFWKQVQTFAARRYSLENTRIITNSDGGQGYTAERFQEAFAQSRHPVWNQLDAYHVAQAVNRVLGYAASSFKDGIRAALKQKDPDRFKLWLDTYESTVEDDKQIEKITAFRTYIHRNWPRIFDWRKELAHPPQNARGLGAMESNQRKVSFRMKKRGMHWSVAGSEAMVKVKQGMINQTLRRVYLSHQRRSTRKQRDVTRKVRLSQILSRPTRPSIGARQGSVSLYDANSTPIGHLKKAFS